MGWPIGRPWPANRKSVVPKSPEVRFWKHVDRRGDDECWPWTGYRQPSGHGQFTYETRPRGLMAAHRFSWELHNRPIPDGLKVCHHCDHGWCVNPAHLFLGTQADNMHDCQRKGRNAKGEQCNRGKLTTSDVLTIRELARNGASQHVIAERFVTARSHVSKIVSGQRWKHLLEEAV